MDNQAFSERTTLDRIGRVDDVCLRFEDEWKANRRPRLEDFIAAVGVEERGELLREMLLVEWAYRMRQQDSFYHDEYTRRFENLHEWVTAAWQAWKQQVSQTDTVDRVGTSGPNLPRIVGFEQVRKLGQGGMGEVYLGFDPRLQRWVALKQVRLQSASEQTLSRFQREALALAKLRHPNIVAVHELRECNGGPLLVLEYVEGGTLQQRLVREEGLEHREAARLVAVLARAMQHAHERGIVHRDLKPGNVLMDAPVAGSPAVLGGIPKIADLGLASLCGTEGELTCEGQIFGTPAYMAPEQAAGRVGEVGAPADVWALGVILYRCLTGVLPFAGDSVLETLERVKAVMFRPLREALPGVDAQLEAVCQACLWKEPKDRPTAKELAERLEAWPGESVGQPRNAGSSTQQAGVRASWRRVALVLVGCFAVGCLVVWAMLGGLGGKADSGELANTPGVEAEQRGKAETSGPSVPKIQPLRATLEVKYHEALREVDRYTGVIGKKVFSTRVGQKVVLRVLLSEPGYAYLIAFNYDGKEQLLWPCKGQDDEGDPDLVPPRKQEFTYPPQTTKGWQLEEEGDDMGGMQAFVVVTSRQALPPFREWRALRAQSPWQRMKAVSEVWRSDGSTLDPLDITMADKRGKSVTLKGQPPLLEVCRWADGKSVERVEGIVFGVMSKDGR